MYSVVYSHCTRYLSTQLVTTNYTSPLALLLSSCHRLPALIFSRYIHIIFCLWEKRQHDRPTFIRQRRLLSAVCLWLTNLARFGCCWLKEGRIQDRCVCVPPLSYHAIIGWNTFWRSIHYEQLLRDLSKNLTIFNIILWVNWSKERPSHRLMVKSFNNFCIISLKIILIILYYSNFFIT